MSHTHPSWRWLWKPHSGRSLKFQVSEEPGGLCRLPRRCGRGQGPSGHVAAPGLLCSRPPSAPPLGRSLVSPPPCLSRGSRGSLEALQPGLLIWSERQIEATQGASRPRGETQPQGAVEVGGRRGAVCTRLPPPRPAAPPLEAHSLPAPLRRGGGGRHCFQWPMQVPVCLPTSAVGTPSLGGGVPMLSARGACRWATHLWASGSQNCGEERHSPSWLGAVGMLAGGQLVPTEGSNSAWERSQRGGKQGREARPGERQGTLRKPRIPSGLSVGSLPASSCGWLAHLTQGNASWFCC